MGVFTETTKNSMLDGLTISDVSLHTADPGATGANEVSGGSPAYARQTPTFAAAATGSRALSADVTFDVPATTVAYVGYWNGTAFLGSDDVTSETFAAQGQYTVTATGTSLSITD